jgi:hypothetical protein
MVTARVSPELVQQLPYYFGDDIHALIAQALPPDAEGWITLSLPFESLPAARAPARVRPRHRGAGTAGAAQECDRFCDPNHGFLHENVTLTYPCDRFVYIRRETPPRA